jgi:hypothetical protein
MAESQLAFAGKLACQAVAKIFHGAGGWMADLLDRLQTARKPETVYDQMLAEFRGFMEEDRGLSPATARLS